jgi:hypothetical protein
MPFRQLNILGTSSAGVAVIETANVVLPQAGIESGSILKIAIEIIIGIVTIFKLLKKNK